MKKLNQTAYELTTCGDTNEQGVIVWLGTTNKVGAVRKLHKLAKDFANHNLSYKKFPRVK